MIYENFRNGINIGGWLSQYDCVIPPVSTPEQMARHLPTYMQERDIEMIASWGFDHIRFPVDYRVLVKTEQSLTDPETAFYYMDRCVEWCEKYHLNIVLDLHQAEGNVYGMMDKPMLLLTEKELRDKFITIWEMLADHFKGRKKTVMMFDLLNEVGDGSGGYLWSSLCRETIQAIHAIDPERYILIGTNEQNSVFCLRELNLLEDDRVFYSFHFYDPLAFTHQQAHFSEDMVKYNRKVHYPGGNIASFTDFLQENREYVRKFARVAFETEVTKERMRVLLKDAFDFVKYTGRELYCGEFGVIDTADTDDAVSWICDVMELLEEYRIGHAIWNYKEMDFGFVGLDGSIKLEERLKRIIEGTPKVKK